MKLANPFTTLDPGTLANAVERLAAPLFESGCFHCTDLFGLCEIHVPGLSDYEARCDWLSAGATEMRYPDTPTKVTPALADQALASARDVFAFVVSHLPAEVRP